MKIIFLDIDGVLNGHDWCEPAKSNRIRYQCIRELNRIIEATGAKIVLSSAWRYMIHGGAMTTTGFEYLFRTHGSCGVRIIGVTKRDEDTPGYDPSKGLGDVRSEQIRSWISDESLNIESFVILDDEGEFDKELMPHLVKCDPGNGMLAEQADAAISILGERTRVELA